MAVRERVAASVATEIVLVQHPFVNRTYSKMWKYGNHLKGLVLLSVYFNYAFCGQYLLSVTIGLVCVDNVCAV